MLSFTPRSLLLIVLIQGVRKRTTPIGPATCGSAVIGEEQLRLKPSAASRVNRKTTNGRISRSSHRTRHPTLERRARSTYQRSPLIASPLQALVGCGIISHTFLRCCSDATKSIAIDSQFLPKHE